MIRTVKNEEVEIGRVVLEIPGDETVGIYPTSIQIVFDDGYRLDNRDDVNYLTEQVKGFALNTLKVSIALLSIIRKNRAAHVARMQFGSACLKPKRPGCHPGYKASAS
jgi:hypothetical protein